MSASQTLGGASRCGWVLGPSLDKIIKNVAWRKHSHLVSACKSALDKLESLSDDASDPTSCSPLYGLSSSDADFLLHPLILAVESGSSKVLEPALDCAFRLFSSGLIRGCEIKVDSSSSIISRLIDSVCKCVDLRDELIELCVLKVLLAAVRSPCIYIRGDCLVYIARSCYNVYLGGRSGTNQICAKSVLAQMMIIVFKRVEENSMFVNLKNISVFELLEFADKNINEGSSIQIAQNFVDGIVEAKDALPDVKLTGETQNYAEQHVNPDGIVDAKDALPDVKLTGETQNCAEHVNPEDHATDLSGYSSIREDGFMLYKNLCKLSMKFTSHEDPDDQILLRGKILSLELLNVIMSNAGPIWHTNERFLNLVKQFLCLSLLKNSALSVMTIFQLLCSIFQNLILKFRSGLKSEIGIFFPMLILRVLENVLQPSFLQKMTVLSLLENVSQDSQIIIDIFVNYDCDVEAPNIFERTVNGLLKTALGPPPGSVTSLSPAQDMAFRHESVKCLVRIIKSMGSWMDQQLKVGESYPTIENSTYVDDSINAEYEVHSDASSVSDAATLEQRRAYKLEIQKGVGLFNRKPSKGIEFLISTKKVGSSPQEVAHFLKITPGLNENMIGDYFGERDEFPMKVMHAYVDSFNFENMGFGEAIRFFLRGFRLPGEAQKIDRIMEKFAEHYCKCNPNSFTSADTAYVLAYSVIMLNTDAHNNMVKDKMTQADFIRNNRGIDVGKDLPEDYLGALYDQIVKNEIKMNVESCAPQSKQGNTLNKLLGLDGILNLVWKQVEEKPLGANGYLIRDIQEQFKAKSSTSETVYYAIVDPAILRFMIEVCWGPMLAAFSVTLDQSDDREATSQCLQGFRHAVHVTAVMGMQTQRDAFVTSVAKFTYLHCAADMKQKNVDAVKAIISVAIEDGNNLQEAWEHILTCLSRFEHLQLLGEGAPPDASFLSSSNSEPEEKTTYVDYPSLKKKSTLQNPSVMAVVRGGSYDSTSVGVNSPGLVTAEQINNFISNLYLLDQIGNFELNHIFAHSQRLNSEAIVAFVKALCKVSILELQSPTDPRVFSLTKIVEVAHYNMNRIRLVWSRIWSVLSEFFVAVGLSENLSVAIFVMDSLRQLAMKFLEREELANYNFQNEFLRPFAVVMQKSCSAEIRELIVRCISQMVLSRVNNIKSGWKSVFTVFTAAAADERKSIVLLAFQTMEKIVREYFPYITETEALTFTDCVKCLITFTSSRFDSDVSLNAIAFLRFCAVKLADGGLACNDKRMGDDSFSAMLKDSSLNGDTCIDKEYHADFWVPLLVGLSKLTSDPRSAIRKSALEVLFNILKDHGHLFSQPFWTNVFKNAIYPIFHLDLDNKESHTEDDGLPTFGPLHDASVWDSGTSMLAAEYLVELFVHFFGAVRPQLHEVVSILVGLIKSPNQGPSTAGVAALMRMATNLRNKLVEEEWKDIFLCLKVAIRSSWPGFINLLKTIDSIDLPDIGYTDNEMKSSSASVVSNYGCEGDLMQSMAYMISKMKVQISLQLLIIQVATDLYKMHWPSSVDVVSIMLDIYSTAASHSHKLNSQTALLLKLEKICSITEISHPPLVHFENESYKNYFNFLHDILMKNSSWPMKRNVEAEFVFVCTEVLQIYLDCSRSRHVSPDMIKKPAIHCFLPLGSAKKEELAARTPLVLLVMRILGSQDRAFFRQYLSQLFPLFVDLVRSEHSSSEVQRVLSYIFQSCIGSMMTN